MIKKSNNLPKKKRKENSLQTRKKTILDELVQHSLAFPKNNSQHQIPD